VSHLSFVAAAYVLGTALPVLFTVEALLRLRSASRRLGAIDPRHRRESIDPRGEP